MNNRKGQEEAGRAFWAEGTAAGSQWPGSRWEVWGHWRMGGRGGADKGEPQEQRDEGCGEGLGPSAEPPALAIRPLGLRPLHRVP